jgi:hypothetical protein
LIISHDPPTDLEATVTGALYLEKGIMNLQSYVRIGHIFDVPVAQLRTCGFPPESKPFDTRLTRPSYEYLAQTFDLREYGNWVPTALLIKACGAYNLLPQAVLVQQGTTQRDLEANRRGPPPNNGTSSILPHFGYVLGFVGIGMIGYLAASALSKGLRSLVRGLARVVQQILKFRALAISNYTRLARSMVLSATAIMRSIYSEYITTD